MKNSNDIEHMTSNELEVTFNCVFSSLLNLYLFLFQYEAALTVDAVSVMMATLTKIQERKPELFRATFKRGRLVNNGTAGLQCKAEPAVPWKIGADVMKIMKSVRI